jgi:hypothetical protein
MSVHPADFDSLCLVKTLSILESSYMNVSEIVKFYLLEISHLIVGQNEKF